MVFCVAGGFLPQLIGQKSHSTKWWTPTFCCSWAPGDLACRGPEWSPAFDNCGQVITLRNDVAWISSYLSSAELSARHMVGVSRVWMIEGDGKDPKTWVLHHLPTIFASPQGGKWMGSPRKINTLLLAKGFALYFYVAFYWENDLYYELSLKTLLPRIRSWRGGLLTVFPPPTSSRSFIPKVLSPTCWERTFSQAADTSTFLL